MKTVFGGLIAAVLLGIYVRLLITAYLIVDCAGISGCTARTPAQFNATMSQTVSVVGGLVSALVIAELAITKPGEAPGGRVLARGASSAAKTWLKWITLSYVLIWLVAGLTAFMKSIQQPEALPVFTSIGQGWLGLAVASAYAYFGIKPQS